MLKGETMTNLKTFKLKNEGGTIENYTVDVNGGGGSGDMAKAVYDTNNDGHVDDSEKLEGSTKAQVQTHVPANHGNEAHTFAFLSAESDPSVDATLKGVNLTTVQDHTPKAHTLTSHSTKAHNELTGIGADDHHAQSHTLTSHSTKAHNELTGIGENDHHTKFTNTEHDTTTRHTLGTIVPHDALANLTEKSHTSLTDIGSNTHAQIDTHVGATTNPHSVTATQVSLGNVTNDAQLKRADGDLNSFTLKGTPVAADVLIIEDSAASYAKKKVTISSISSVPTTNKQYNQSVAQQSLSSGVTRLIGSGILIPAGSLKIGTRYHFILEISKTDTTSTATPIFVVEFGTGNASTDADILTFTFLAQTAAADKGTCEIWVTFRTVGSGTSAVIAGCAQMRHRLSITGLQNLVCTTLGVVSSGFDSTVANSYIGVSVNVGTSATWVCNVAQAELENLI